MAMVLAVRGQTFEDDIGRWLHGEQLNEQSVLHSGETVFFTEDKYSKYSGIKSLSTSIRETVGMQFVFRSVTLYSYLHTDNTDTYTNMHARVHTYIYTHIHTQTNTQIYTRTKLVARPQATFVQFRRIGVRCSRSTIK